MSRYIDADALMRNLQLAFDGVGLIEIVRCKECTERDDDWCMYFGKMTNPDDFCSYGERSGE
jgi:hypothetical protein